ncbi:uncharacterized protein LOC132707092 [Cylas formicarius]|uniref:uncharacterized protein LOC132707092 n=1 Tax=Cylas formicarius TaxID=197179 RepID=UPI002958D02F|nr:uncharacterized protein LOC132707092 [Cylas formicarius]
MFPTFISILDIQSWWEVPSIAHFCSLFRSAFNLLDFDIEDLEEALLTDGTEETSWLQELIVKLLSGCLPNNEISTFNYQMFLRRLFRQKCQEHDRYNPFNTDIDFTLLPLRTKVDILHALCDFRLDADDVLEELKNLEADSLRVEPLGYDCNESAYWYFYGTRLYREDYKTKNNKKKSIWQVICFTEEDWIQLTKKFKSSASKAERALYHTLSKNFLPELPRLFQEKERQARRRLLETQPRRVSDRIKKLDPTPTATQNKSKELQDVVNCVEESQKPIQLGNKKKEHQEKNLKHKKGQEEVSDCSENRYDMGGKKKCRGRLRKISSCSTSSQDNSKKKKTKKLDKLVDEVSKCSSSTTPTIIGRQTNNSLSASDGQIVIQSTANKTKKKLKSSEIFQQTEEDLQVGMHKILDYVKNHDDAWPFLDPVEEEYAPNYYSIVRKPMDLQRMEDRLDAGYYKTFAKFKSDFHLIVENCRLYNGVENEYTEMVDNLLHVFETATEKYLDRTSSSDEEITIENIEMKQEDHHVGKHGKKKKSESPSQHCDRGVKSSDQRGRRERSRSVESAENPKGEKASKKQSKKETRTKKERTDVKKAKQSKDDKSLKKKTHKKKRSSPCRNSSPAPSCSPARSYVSSPPPSSPDSRFDFAPRKQGKKRSSQEPNDGEEPVKAKKSGKKEDFVCDDIITLSPECLKQNVDYPSLVSPKPKDKHNKLRETIEKLKAKNDIARLKQCEFEFELDDHLKENKDKNKKVEKDDKSKPRHKDKVSHKSKRGGDVEEASIQSESDRKLGGKKYQAPEPPVVPKPPKSHSNFDALSIATEQTLKDINKWLDDTPKFADFSSASNSPSYLGLDDFDLLGSTNKTELKKVDKILSVKKDGPVPKEVKKKTFRDPVKFFKRREIQRTIDRLQPGKSKGNLISSVQSSVKVDEMFPLGPLSKIKDTKNSLIVKTDTNAPKLSLGSVLDSFGKHRFVDDLKKEERGAVEPDSPEKAATEDANLPDLVKDQIRRSEGETEKVDKEENSGKSAQEPITGGEATPNLSAWFKAFGAPKAPAVQKKSEAKSDANEDEVGGKMEKVAPPDPSPSLDSPQPVTRQRRISTGSSVSERSSFSQDLDSPRVGMDERGAYPAPYPSPLHRSPSGASPIMASPRPDISPRSAAYPSFNGQIRVGFYQDTVSNKSSPDKASSPRDNPQSPYSQFPSNEHVYAPNTTHSSLYSYANSPFYTHTPNYSSTNPTPPYNTNTSSPAYYDTSKSLTDQYQNKICQNHPANSPASNQASPVNQNSPHSPIPHPQLSPSLHSQNSSSMHSQHSPSVHSQHSPSVHSQHSPSVHSQHSPSVHSQHSPSMQSQHSPSLHSPNMHSQHSPHPQHSPGVETFHGAEDVFGGNGEKSSSPVFPVKKRVYSDADLGQLEDTSNEFVNRNIHLGHQVSLVPKKLDDGVKQSLVSDSFNKSCDISTSAAVEQMSSLHQHQHQQQINSGQISSPGLDFNAAPNQSNVYPTNFNSEPNYPVSVASTRALPQHQTKLDMTKYTNMGYSGPEVNYSKALQQQYTRSELNYIRTTIQSTTPQVQSLPNTQQSVSMSGFVKQLNSTQQVRNNYSSNRSVESVAERLAAQVQQEMSGTYKSDLSTRGTYNSTSVDVNLSHIVDRYNSEDRMMAGLQPTATSYYSDKGLGAAHIFNKSMANGSQMFSQTNMEGINNFNQTMQGAPSLYNRHINELQAQCDLKNNPQVPSQDKKPKKKKNKAAAAICPPNEAVPGATPPSMSQGFQSYTGLKVAPNSSASPLEPSAISLKTSSVVPGSAFNFGPTASGALGLGSGLYGDKDAYSNFLEDFRTAPNYYMAAAAAAHHRPPTDPAGNAGKSNQPTVTQSYPAFLNAAHQSRTSAYPLGGAFIPPAAQAQLMDTSSQLYQHYLQAGVLNQSLLGPPGPYPPGYHPALSMRQPYDSMTRPSWL